MVYIFRAYTEPVTRENPPICMYYFTKLYSRLLDPIALNLFLQENFQKSMLKKAVH